MTWDSFSDAVVEADDFKGLKEVTVATSKLGNLGNLTVNDAGAVTVTAGEGMKGNLVVNGVTTGVVNGGAAKTVTVDAEGSADTDDTVTVTAGETTTAIEVGINNAFDSAAVTAGAVTTDIEVEADKTVTVTAGAATKNITTTSNSATIDASAAAKDAIVTVNKGADASTATVTLGNDATVTSNLAGTEKLTLDVAAGKTVTLTGIAGAETLEVKGAGDVTLKATAANLTTDTDTVTKSNTGTLTVDLTGTALNTAVDTAKVAADLFKVKAAAGASLVAKSGQTFEVAAAAATATVDVAVKTASDADALTLKLTSAAYANITNASDNTDIETLTIVAAAAQAVGDATATDLTIGDVVAGAANSVVLTGTNDVQLTKVTSAKEINASALVGTLKVGVGAGNVVTEGVIAGATGVNTVAFGAIAAGKSVSFIGQAANDVVTLTSTAVAGVSTAAGQANIILGAGNDRLTVSSAIAGVLSVQAGEGDDVVSLAGNNTGTVVLEFGNGSDTLALADGASLANAASVVLTGLETIKIDNAATVAASQVSGQSYAVQGTTDGYTGNVLNIVGTSAADTIDVSKLVATDSATIGAKLSVNGGAGADTILLGASTETVVVNVTSTPGATPVYASESSATAYDKISGFTLGTDKLSIADTDGTAQAFTLVTTAVAAQPTGVSAVVSDKGVVSFAKDGVALAAGSVEIDTLAEIVALIDAAVATDGKVVGVAFNDNTYVFGQNGTSDVLVELTGVTGVTDFTGLLA